jgi:hypothetical protein
VWLGNRGNARVDLQWVFASQPITWQYPPPEVDLKERTGPVELIVLYPSGEYGYVACYIIQRSDRSLTISRGDGFLVKVGTWRRNGNAVLVTSRTVYQEVLQFGKPLPGPVIV